MLIMVAVAGVVLLTLTAISNSACAVCFCQPREPAVLYSFIKGRRKYNENTKIGKNWAYGERNWIRRGVAGAAPGGRRN